MRGATEKTIVHIPSVNSRESTKDKIREVEHIIEELGEWQGSDPATGFQLVKTSEGRVLRVADLVDDDPAKRDRVAAALKDSTQKNNRDHVDIIIALGMAKEGFDWIWCEHALTVDYRSSLTEIVQIIGRATRDAPGKLRARFTNLIAEPDASEEAVTEAVNDTLTATAASLLMEQVLAPRFEFKPKNPQSGPTPGFDYGSDGYDPKNCNVGFNEESGQFEIEIKGLVVPKSEEAQRICQQDLNEVIAAFVQDKTTITRGLFDGEHAGGETLAEELTQLRMGKIIKYKFPELDEADQEAVRQHAVAALNLTQKAKETILGAVAGDGDKSPNIAFIEGVRRFAMDVRDLDIDLIDRINPFGEAYAILAKTMSEERLKQVATVISGKTCQPDDGRGAGPGETGVEVQTGARPVAFYHVTGRLGKAHGRRRGLPSTREGGGGRWLRASPKRMTHFSRSLASTPRRRRSRATPPREERIIAGFEEIQRFVEQHSRAPQHGEDRDIRAALCRAPRSAPHAARMPRLA
jgi:hypothetical protein